MGDELSEVKPILVLGACEDLLGAIKERCSDISLFNHHDEIYSLGKGLINVKVFFIVESKCTINPLFIVRTISGLFPHIKIVIIYNGSCLDFSQAQDLERFQFNFLGEKTKAFKKGVWNYI